jgi:hypothetical protein
MSDNETKDDNNNNNTEIEMSSSNNYKQYILCYNELNDKGKTWDEHWVVNENHIDAVAMEDIVEQVEEKYEWEGINDSNTNNNDNIINKDIQIQYETGCTYYAQHIKGCFLVIHNFEDYLDEDIFEDYLKTDDKKVKEDEQSKHASIFLETGQYVIEKDDLIFYTKGIFFCILALFVSIIIMGLLEVFVMFFDDSITVKTDIHRYDANNQTYLRSSNITTTTDIHSSLTTSTSSPASLIATTTSPPPPINPPPTTMTTTTFMHDNITNNTSNTSWSL